MILQEAIDDMSRCQQLTVEELDTFNEVWSALDLESDVNFVTKPKLIRCLSKSTYSEKANELAVNVMIKCLTYASQISSRNNRPTFTAKDLLLGAKLINSNFKIQWQDELTLRGKKR